MPRTWVFSLPIVFSDTRGARVPGGHICRTLAVAGYIFCRESARSSAGREGDTTKTIRMRTQWYPTSTSMRGVTWKTLLLNVYVEVCDCFWPRLCKNEKITISGRQ
jgi:hypothetical protein